MNFANLVQQAQQMQRKVNKVKKAFDDKEFDFVSQNSVISGKIKGNLEIISLNIDSSLMNNDSKEDVEDLLIVTLNQIIKKVSQEREDTINKVTNGVDVSAFL